MRWLLLAFILLTVAGLAAELHGYHGISVVRVEQQRVARDAVSRGEILPLAKLLQQQRPHLGEVVGERLERCDNTLLYEFRSVASNGHVQIHHFLGKSGQHVEILTGSKFEGSQASCRFRSAVF